MSASPARVAAEGLLLDLRVAPGASRTAVAGVETDAAGVARLKLRIAAPPVDGAANEAVIAFLAKAFKRPKRDLDLTKGQTSRSKTVLIRGAADALMARLDALLGDAR